MVQISGENSKPLWSMCPGRMKKCTSPSPQLPKDEGLKDIGHSMSIENLILGVYSVMVSYLICYDSLLQNATDIITKCDSFFLQNATKVYYKMRQFLQNATFITNCDSILCHMILKVID